MSDEVGFLLAAGNVVAGRYRLDRLLGEGGMGIVWAARHTVTKRPVALKFLKGYADASARRRLVREARAAGAINHPAMVAIHDVIESPDGEPALVMDLLDGESLRKRLLREHKLPLAEACRIVVELCEALGAAHAAGIVHRDLKPENIVQTPDGKIRVLDFGVAKIMPIELGAQDGEWGSSGTRSGDVIGTPMFMSPEQMFGERSIDHRTDLWSLGLLACECLTGVLPTRSDNLGQVLKIVLTRQIKPVASYAPEIPLVLCAMVDRMLAFDRQDRPWSTREVAEAFASAVGCAAPTIPEPMVNRESAATVGVPSSHREVIAANPDAFSGAFAPTVPVPRSGVVTRVALGLGALATAVAFGLWAHFTESTNAQTAQAPRTTAITLSVAGSQHVDEPSGQASSSPLQVYTTAFAALVTVSEEPVPSAPSASVAPPIAGATASAAPKVLKAKPSAAPRPSAELYENR